MLGYIRQLGVIQDYEGPTGSYGAVWDHTGPYGIRDHMGSYGTIQDLVAPYEQGGIFWEPYSHEM